MSRKLRALRPAARVPWDRSWDRFPSPARPISGPSPGARIVRTRIPARPRRRRMRATTSPASPSSRLTRARSRRATSQRIAGPDGPSDFSGRLATGPLASRSAAPLGPNLATVLLDPAPTVDRHERALLQALDSRDAETDEDLYVTSRRTGRSDMADQNGEKQGYDPARDGSSVTVAGLGALPLKVSAPPSGGRAADLDALLAALGRASGPEGQIAVVAGGPRGRRSHGCRRVLARRTAAGARLSHVGVYPRPGHGADHRTAHSRSSPADPVAVVAMARRAGRSRRLVQAVEAAAWSVRQLAESDARISTCAWGMSPQAFARNLLGCPPGSSRSPALRRRHLESGFGGVGRDARLLIIFDQGSPREAKPSGKSLPSLAPRLKREAVDLGGQDLRRSEIRQAPQPVQAAARQQCVA